MLPCAITTWFPVRCLSLLLAMSSRVYLFSPPRGHEPPSAHPPLPSQPTTQPLTPSLSNPSLCQTPGCRSVRNRSSLFPSYTPSSPNCTIKVSEHDSIRQPPAAYSDERPHPQKYSRAQPCLNALTPGYFKGTVVRGHPVVWSLAPCLDDAKQDWWWCTVQSLA